MSIHGEIGDRVSEGRLFLVKPRSPSRRLLRTMLATPEVYAKLQGPWLDETVERRMAQLQTDLEVFTSANFIDKAYLKRLQRSDGIWEIRSCRPRPSLRVFGAFGDLDVLVITHMAERRNLGAGNSREWAEEIRRTKAIWRNLFPSYDWEKGESIDDVLTQTI